MEAIKHAMLSPSGASRWMACLGSPALEHGLPDNGNEYSAEGTCAHKVAAMCFAEGKPASAYIGRRVDVGPHETYEFREDMAAPTQLYVDFVLSLPGEKFYEVAVPIDHITGEEGAEGTADTVCITEDQEELICVDLKFGVGVYVAAEHNKQGLMYASGAVRKYDVMGSIKRVRIFIHQPRINAAPSEWDCTIEELRAFEAQVQERAGMAMIAFRNRENWIGKSESYLTVGDEQCKFCKAKATCPAQAKFVEETVGQSFENIPASGMTGIPSITTSGSQVLCPDDELASRMKACDLIEGWIKAVRAEVERRLLASIPVPGYKLVEGRQGNRAWTDEKAVEDLLRKQFRLPIEEAFNLKLISPTQAEKLLETAHPKRWEKCQPLIGRSPGVPSVAPEGDKRPALSVKPVAEDFEAVVEGADLV